MTLAACARLNSIEAVLASREADGFELPFTADARWMLEQIRGWQKFGKRVVDFGGLVEPLRDSQIANCRAIAEAYDAMFSPPAEVPRG